MHCWAPSQDNALKRTSSRFRSPARGFNAVFGRPRSRVTKCLVHALAIAATIATATAAERPYLAPVDGDLSVLSVAPALQAYNLAAREALVGAGGNRAWEAVIFPSSQREWAVYVEKVGSSGAQQVVCARMQTQLCLDEEELASLESAHDARQATVTSRKMRSSGA